MKLPTPEDIISQLKEIQGKLHHDDALLLSLSGECEDGYVLDFYPIVFDPPEKLDKIAEVLMELSLRCNVESIEVDIDEGQLGALFVTLVDTDDETTNITADVIQAFMDMAQGFSI